MADTDKNIIRTDALVEHMFHMIKGANIIEKKILIDYNSNIILK